MTLALVGKDLVLGGRPAKNRGHCTSRSFEGLFVLIEESNRSFRDSEQRPKKVEWVTDVESA